MNGNSNYSTGRDFWDGAVNMTPAAQLIHTVFSITSPYEASLIELSVFVYCCDSEDTIINTLENVVEALGVVGKSFEIIVIDDCSKDHSVEFIRGFMTEFPAVSVVLRINKKRKGLAQNYYDAAFIGCGKYFRLIYGDNAEPVETMVDVFNAIGDADIVVPYYVSMNNSQMGLYTRLLNIISGNKINCYTAAHLHLRYNVMRWHSNTMGIAFQADLLCKLLDVGFTCKQVPCRAVPYHVPASGFQSIRNFLSALYTLLDIGIRRI